MFLDYKSKIRAWKQSILCWVTWVPYRVPRAEERAAKEQRFREFGPGYLYSSPLFSKTTLHDVTLRPTSNALRTIPST